MEPGVIQKLDEVVVNRIAAGEIIQKPANALKELIENSLDAKANYIQITVKSGGLKLLQIQDNGTGIRHEDLGIVCERFTTSKLTKFEDLANIATFGFRGEALASISHVAHLTIQTKTAQEKCGYKASYEDGKLKAPPKPCAGNQGTIITIEDLFYTMPQRRQVLKSPAEEFQKISDIVAKYAVHNANVGFMLKRFGEQASLRTASGSTREENIRIAFGSQIAKELMELELKDEVHKFKINALITKVNYSAKKGIMLLFINHRLVDSPALKAAVDAAYNVYLPKGMHPFTYFSLELEPNNIDVNVHPTKHEVHFLYEDEIIEKIKSSIESKLLGSNSTRTFYKQLKLPGIASETAKDANESMASKNSTEQRVYAKDMIRTDAKLQKLDKFILPHNNAEKINGSAGFETQNKSCSAEAVRKLREVRLTSVLNMQKRIELSCSVMLRKTLKDLVFVGVVDITFALFQFETKLFMCDIKMFSEELFFQRLVYEFQNFAKITFEPCLQIKQLLMIALNSEESGWSQEDGEKEALAERAAEILCSKAAIMQEYFAMRITPDGMLESLPEVLHQHRPCIAFLPNYMLRLATEVEWDTEEECFKTFCRETAKFYARTSEVNVQQHPKRYKWVVEHQLFPAFKQYLLPPNRLKQYLYELTNLPTLYKVFERC